MFILEEPYVSPLLLETAEKNRFSILTNSIADKFKNSYNLNILSEKSAINLFNSDENPLIYSNSENSINWVMNNFGNSNLAKNIKLFKDKNKFRELLSSIYPDFFFREYGIDELEALNIDTIVKPFIIKPTVGFLSLGVYTVSSNEEWNNTLSALKENINKFAEMFPADVVNYSKFIIEEFIEGEEFAVDAYFSKSGKPVILNIFQHPFVSENDVSDRVYITSKEIIENNLERFSDLLSKIGKLSDLKSFPMHIELRVSKSGKIVPIEINPMRFAGWCCTDTAYFAYGINVYEYYFNQLEPDWENILKGKDGNIYYMAIAEVPSNIKNSDIEDFQYSSFLNNFSNILEVRKIDYKEKPLFAIIFGQTEGNKEINEILSLKMNNYIKLKEEKTNLSKYS